MYPYLSQIRRTMTVVVVSNDDDAACQPHATSALLDQVEIHFDDDDDLIERMRETNSKRKFPSWTKTQIPRWGTRIFVPEWDDDEIIDDDNNKSNDDGDIDDERDSCDYGSGREDEADEYRIRSGWKVRSCCFCHKGHAIAEPRRGYQRQRCG